MEPSDLYQGEIHLSPLQQVWQRFQQNHIALVGLWFILLVVVVSIVVPWFLPYSPTEQNPAQVLIPPSWEPNGSVIHLFGTDDLGRDVFTRILYGSRTTFLPVLSSCGCFWNWNNTWGFCVCTEALNQAQSTTY